MSANDIAVSVIICVRNGAQTIRQQLDALSGQQSAPPFEVLVSDNGSSDRTAEIVQQWIMDGIGAPARARMVDSSAVAGIPHARNVGARHATGTMLAFCDADDVVDPGWVRAIALSRVAVDGRGAVGGRVCSLSTDRTPSAKVLLSSLDGVATTNRAYPSYPSFWGCNFAVHRDTYAAVGGFDESLPPYGCDDIDICLRLGTGGHPIHYEDAMVVHYDLPRGLRRRLRRKFLSGTAMACVWHRNPTPFPTIPSLIALLARVIVAPFDPLTAPGLHWKERVVRSAESLATQVGLLHGNVAWVRSGRLGRPLYFEPPERGIEHR